MTSKRPVPFAEPGYEPRDRGLKRRDLFLDAAMEVFIERGYEAASLQEIVNRAGGSLATLYRLFGNKEGLFHAVIERKAESVLGGITVPEQTDMPPDQLLFMLGSRLLDLILSKEAIGVHRLIIAEGAKNPQLREIFMDIAPNRTYAFLTEYFKLQIKAGRFRDCDPRLAAIQYFEMVKGSFYMRSLLGEDIKLSRKERQHVVQHAVDIFLQGIGK